nr:MAG TPA_asm: hypothetical protein [Caudoviricetes sp.]
MEKDYNKKCPCISTTLHKDKPFPAKKRTFT